MSVETGETLKRSVTLSVKTLPLLFNFTNWWSSQYIGSLVSQVFTSVITQRPWRSFLLIHFYKNIT